MINSCFLEGGSHTGHTYVFPGEIRVPIIDLLMQQRSQTYESGAARLLGWAGRSGWRDQKGDCVVLFFVVIFLWLTAKYLMWWRVLPWVLCGE